MTAYIALFRGINVGGNKVVKMETLRNLLESVGLSDVKTYIQSGNVVFKSSQTAGRIQVTIAGVFPKAFGLESRVSVRSIDEWTWWRRTPIRKQRKIRNRSMPSSSTMIRQTLPCRSSKTGPAAPRVLP